jgi:hypothetical protein
MNGSKLPRVCVISLVTLSIILSTLLVSRVSAGPSITSFIVTLRSCDKDGNTKTTFGPAEFVYACGTGFTYVSGEEITLRVIPDNAVYRDYSSVCNVVAKADSLGHLGPVKLCVLTPGEYDIWADRNGDGWLNSGSPRPEPVAGLGCPRGFLVVPEFFLGTVLGLAGCFGALAFFYATKRKRTVF